MTKKRFTALGGDTFAGLFIQGIKKAGFEVLGSLEHTNYGVKTSQLNHPDVDIRCGTETWEAERYAGKVDFMFTNPPCAIWSAARAGEKGSWKTDERLRWVPDLIDAGLKIKPKAWAWESVTNAWLHGRDYVMAQMRRWSEAGYSVTILLQNNMYLGVPQNRPRMFAIAHTHPLAWPELGTPRTVGEVFKDIKVPKKDERPLCDGYNHLLWEKSATFGGSMRRAHDTSEVGCRTGRFPCFIERRLVWDKVAPVLMGGSTARLHPKKPRYLDRREYLALCGMDDWLCHSTSMDVFVRELSRSVMPPVGAWLGRAVMDGLARPKIRRQTCQLVDMRDPDDVKTQDLDIFTSLVDLPWEPDPHDARPVAKTPKKETTVRGSSSRKPGSGARIRGMILDGVGVDAILEIIHREFPQSKATAADVSWNRGRLRKEGSL